VHVVIVDLLSEGCRSGRTGVHVKSNKGERALVAVTVRADESALTKSHVRLERKRCGCARDGVGSHAAAADVRQTNKSVEVRDLRRIVDVDQGEGGIQRIVVDEDPEGSKSPDTPRNRIGQGTTAPFALIVVSMSRLWR
jgi:hypothetical protein